MSDNDSPGPQNHRRPWREADDRELTQLIEAREPPARIARQMQRTQDAIRGRAAHLGLTVPSALRPWRRQWSSKATGLANASNQQHDESGDPASGGGDK